MLELTGMGSVLRGIGWLYWLVAAGAIYLAISKGKGRRAKVAWATLAVVLFAVLPVKQMVERAKRDIYAREAWAYFKKKCDTEAGEKIYKTYTDVKSVLVVKPLPPATEKDMYDQFWYGDPYSAPAHSRRGEYEASILASPRAPVARGVHGRGFQFAELVRADAKEIIKIHYPVGATSYRTQTIDRPVSRFGISWEDISTPEDRKYWVARSRLRVIDLANQSIAAERIGIFIEAGFGSTAAQRRPWLASRGAKTTCPYSHDWSDRWFVLSVLRPDEGEGNGK